MLHLIDPVRYSAGELSFINSTLKPLGKNGWYYSHPMTRSIKHHISEHTIIAQGGRCAYCERILSRGEVEIEHIAHKKDYGCFTFEPFNLVSSCTCCNAPCNKGQNNTVSLPANRIQYDSNHFIIVHPYFDKPDEHIKFLDADHIIIDFPNCSKKGKETVRMFHWQEYSAIIKRAETASLRHYPLDVLKLAAEISTYK